MKFTLTLVLSLSVAASAMFSDDRYESKESQKAYDGMDKTKGQVSKVTGYLDTGAKGIDLAKKITGNPHSNLEQKQKEASTAVQHRATDHWAWDLFQAGVAVLGAEEDNENVENSDLEAKQDDFLKRFTMNCWEILELEGLSAEEKADYLKNGLPISKLMELLDNQVIIMGPGMDAVGVRHKGKYFEMRDAGVRNPNAVNHRYFHLGSPRRRIGYE